jgi:hypothetical protein
MICDAESKVQHVQAADDTSKAWDPMDIRRDVAQYQRDHRGQAPRTGPCATQGLLRQRSGHPFVAGPFHVGSILLRVRPFSVTTLHGDILSSMWCGRVPTSESVLAS